MNYYGSIFDIKCVFKWKGILFCCVLFCIYFHVGSTFSKETKKPVKNAIYNGAVFGDSSWFVYSSAVRSIWGEIHDQGWQVRVMAGQGVYRYGKGITYVGNKTVAEVMIGYQYITRPFFLKLYVGPHYEEHSTVPLDKRNDLIGAKYGAKVQFEGWMDWGLNQNFIGLDASFSTLENSYLMNVKVGIEPINKIQIGLEAEVSGNNFSDQLSGGVFTSYRWKKNSVLGASFGTMQNSLDQKGFWAKLKYDVKF